MCFNPKTGAHGLAEYEDTPISRTAAKFHSATLSNNTAGDLRILLFSGISAPADSSTIAGQAVAGVRLLGWVTVPAGQTQALDYGDSGLPTPTGFSVIISSAALPGITYVDLTASDATVCPIAFS